MSPKKPVWHTDADNIDPSIIHELVFHSDSVDDFILKGNKHFIVASKGIGKTLLLKYKKFLLDKKYISNSDKGCIFIPQQKPYLDFVSDFGTGSEVHDNIMTELYTSRKLWTISIMVSVLSYYMQSSRSSLTNWNYEIEELSNKHNRRYDNFINWCKGKRRVDPTYVLHNILYLGLGPLNKFIDSYFHVIEDIFKSVHSSIFVFIDRIDQSVRKYGKDAWVHFQAGLIEAAWDVMRINPHIKIYTSIRQEAYYNYSSSDKEAISGNVTFMKYSHEDLHKITDHHCKFYEDVDTFFDFVGFEKIRNTFSNTDENCFRYAQRHTLGRPRDVVVICSQLSSKKNITHEGFRKSVHQSSHLNIGKNIFSEMEFLFHSLDNLAKQTLLLSTIPQNILKAEEIKSICKDLNGSSICNNGACKQCDGLHVFCDLFNIGLLGIIKKDHAKDDKHFVFRQKFLGPYDIGSFEKGSLPPTNLYYLIHPCLQHYIEECRNNTFGKDYKLVDHVLVGHNYIWTERCTLLADLFYALKEIRHPDIKNRITLFTNELILKEKSIDETRKEFANLNNYLEKTADYSGKMTKILSLIEKISNYMETILP